MRVFPPYSSLLSQDSPSKKATRAREGKEKTEVN